LKRRGEINTVGIKGGGTFGLMYTYLKYWMHGKAEGRLAVSGMEEGALLG